MIILITILCYIAGRFGAAIMEYFSFIKWLVILNFLISLLTLSIIIPQVIFENAQVEDSVFGN